MNIRTAASNAVAYLLWPGILSACIAANYWAMQQESPFVWFNLLYLTLAASLFFLERLRPFEKTWLPNDGQIPADLLHTFFNKGIVQILVIVGTVFGAAEAFSPDASAIWPTEWPLAAQVVLGLVIAELGLYGAHRLAHEWRWLWKFHAIHHSSSRLTIINTGRFHFFDTGASIILSQPLLFLVGAPVEIFKWTSAITAFIGILTHCNIEMRFGFLSLIFNTPELHRWHHSKDLAEGNKNYGENLMIFDQLFGTYFRGDYRPPADIGIKEYMPPSFIQQVVHPFKAPKTAERGTLPAE